MSKITALLEDAIVDATKQWTRAKLQSGRRNRVGRQTLGRLRAGPKPPNLKQASFRVMREAYLKASAGGRLPANARQVMYAARPLVLALTGGECWKNSATFTQKYLPEYLERHAPGWDVVFDARGHLADPHTGHSLGMGTLEVRGYVRRWRADVREEVDVEVLLGRVRRVDTHGPANRYRSVLFVEKEGFNPLLEAARVAERFDLAVMSTKGMSVTAARQLVEHLSRAGATIFVLHDFDKSGLTILHTLAHDTRRYRFAGRPNVVDLGLRLADVERLGLPGEPVGYDSTVDPRHNLRLSGASEAECAFLVRGPGEGGWAGERVELNAMSSDQLIGWLEGKLRAHGVGKFVPGEDALAAAYRRAARLAALAQALDEVDDRAAGDLEVPEDLEDRVRAAIEDTDRPWDAAVWDLARDHRRPEGEQP